MYRKPGSTMTAVEIVSADHAASHVMASTTFPTWAECLEEFAVGMREIRTVEAVVAPGAVPISPLLRKPPISYADFMAGREQKDLGA